jgi:gliding motility-associated-like protein
MSTKPYSYLRSLLLALLVFGAALPLLATHNRAGQITVRQIGDCVTSLTVEVTITTFTKASSRPADRDTLTIFWGDGTFDRVGRVNGPGNPPQGDLLENDTKKNLYVMQHTYPARGSYVISMTDPNRNGGILNVNPPSSDQIRFHLETRFTFLNPQFQGCNSSPILLQDPIDIACVGRRFTHNPGAFDPDGDSIAYRLTVPLQDVGTPVPNYSFPNFINPNPVTNQLTIDERTGDIAWDAPQRAGEYNLAMYIISYRGGVATDTILRDIQILVKECENLPPEVNVPFDEICVVAGELLQFEVVGTAPLIESNQKVRLTASGGPFAVPFRPATFLPNQPVFLDQPVRRTFRWETSCEHISDQFYNVVFKATDDFFGDTTGLATLKSVRIKVVGPPPEGVRAEAVVNQVRVSWDLPYFCDGTLDNYFRGFTVWKRLGSNDFPLDECRPGLAGRGYTRLTNVPIRQEEDGRYVFYDSDVERGRTYCYRILGQFARTTAGGQYTYNVVESLPSDEACVQLNRDIPLLTNVDVLATGMGDGQIEVCWSKPLPDDLDTLQNPGPYRYEVLRATGANPADNEFQPIGISFSSPDFASANDTCFIDDGLNTRELQYSYKLNFYVRGNDLMGTANAASSVFLSIEPTDKTNILSWRETVPWENNRYTIFRRDAQGGFDSIATVQDPTYRDMGLVNGREYCYYVRSTGSYGIAGVKSPLLNRSQIACAVPIDNIPPCPTILQVSNACDQLINCTDEEALNNTLSWENPNDLCEDTDDVVGYRIYYAPFEGSDFVRIAEIDDSRITEFVHKPDIGIAGCYAVTAIDTVLNESLFSNIVCVDNCPNYSLPNTFTPNGDGQNDIFRPYPYCFIDRVEFNVFNRWGQLVFTATDPDINWNGNNLQGKALEEGTYYYTCRYYERRVSGITPAPEVLSGYIMLLRGNQ